MSQLSVALPPGLQENQLQPSGTSAVQLYIPLKWFRYPGVGSSRPIGTLDFIAITNPSGAEAKYTIYHDDDGATYNSGTVIGGEEIPLGESQTHFVGLNIGFRNTAGTIGVKVNIANTLVFTPYVSFPSG